MKALLYGVLFLLITYTVYLSAFSVLHGEVNFFNDVARDFLLLQEISEKKIVFIGPRSNTSGLFHGPLWSYVNYPAYAVGHGDPVVAAWYWIALGIVFLASSFFIAKKLFGEFAAWVYILILSARLVPHINGVFHSEATVFLMPFLFFTMCMYIRTKRKLYLVLHVATLAALIQLNIGVGIPLFLLSLVLTIWIIAKQRLLKHAFVFLLLPLFLSNLIIFDVRHNFQMTHALVSSGRDTRLFISANSLIENRIKNILSFQILHNDNNLSLPAVIFILVIMFTVIHMRTTKEKRIYFLFLFYYFGYMTASFMSRGVILYHYVYLLVPFTTLWLVSFLEGKYKLLFAPLVLIVFLLNFQSAYYYTLSLQDFMGKSENSWKGLSAIMRDVKVSQNGKEFGYFVFSPDAFAYQGRYAAMYNFKKANAHAFEYTKKATTYVIAAPPPANDPYMTHVWWRKNSVKIASRPVEAKKFPNGYTTEEFRLSPEEQKIPHDKTIELGIHFR